jgi:hypothetical protein
VHTSPLPVTPAVRAGRRPAARRRGFLVVEIAAGLGLALAVGALLTMCTLRYGAVRRQTDAQRQLWSAATAQLERLRAGLTPLPAPGSECHEPSAATDGGPQDEVQLVIRTAAGTGPWEGLLRVEVTATAPAERGRTATLTLTEYLAPPEATP